MSENFNIGAAIFGVSLLSYSVKFLDNWLFVLGTGIGILCFFWGSSLWMKSQWITDRSNERDLELKEPNISAKIRYVDAIRDEDIEPVPESDGSYSTKRYQYTQYKICIDLFNLSSIPNSVMAIEPTLETTEGDFKMEVTDILSPVRVDSRNSQTIVYSCQKHDYRGRDGDKVAVKVIPMEGETVICKETISIYLTGPVMEAEYQDYLNELRDNEKSAG